MIQHFQEEIFQRMSPEAKARKLSVMRALAKSMRAKNKENENPLNNNTSLPIGVSLKQSIPLIQITDFDEIVSDSDSKILEKGNSPDDEDTENELENSQLNYARVYDPECESIEFENVTESTDNDWEDINDTVILAGNKQWNSLEVLHENAEYEFCRSLEESKLYVSSAILLEEIEADLPPPYSLAKPLVHTSHTVLKYRTQMRLARMDLNSTCPKFLNQENGCEGITPNNRLVQLEKEAMVQGASAKQAEKALNLSKSQKLFWVQRLECEKALLLANLRLQTTLQEMKKVKLTGNVSKEEVFGQITISDVFFQVDVSPENVKEQFLCVAIEKENVLSSSVIGDCAGGKLHFSGEFKFDKLRMNFVITLELYKLNLKEPKKTILNGALVKKLRRMIPVNTNRSIMYPQYGKSCFVRVTSAELRLDHITSREDGKRILLNNLTEHLSGGSVVVSVETDIKANFQLSGFLNIFKQTWHRRWYTLSGYFLESWLYPEDREAEKPPVDCISLIDYISATPVGIEDCIRPNCFAINLKSTDAKILFSADSRTDLDQWVKHVNLVIGSLLAWRPNL